MPVHHSDGVPMKLLSLTSVIFLCACSQPERLEQGNPEKAAPRASICKPSGVCQISMISLIALPHEFDGKDVRFNGYLVPDGENTKIYLDKESAEENLKDRAIVVRESDRENLKGIFSGPSRYVSLMGRFTDPSHQNSGVHRAFKEAGVIEPTFPASAINQ